MHWGQEPEVAGMPAMPEQAEWQREVAGKIPRLSSGPTRGIGPSCGGAAAQIRRTGRSSGPPRRALSDNRHTQVR